ncbi:FAD dependent oxidoreductase [Pyrenochaeta sp. DS3sAY3a]|nr:FAD dependent oxidoreductase [Pyrenochaeta sp. DS3sAY3a]
MPFLYYYLVSAADQQLQESLGAGTKILPSNEIESKYTFFYLDDVKARSLNLVDEGAFDAFGVVESLRWKARENGVDYIANEITGIERIGNRIESITLSTGQVVKVSTVVNAAGTRAAAISRLSMNLCLRIYRSQSIQAVFTCAPTVSTIIWWDVLPLGPDIAVSPDGFGYEDGVWEEKVLPILRRSIPSFATAKVTDSWVGHYEFNTFDRNAILGPHTDVSNLLFCAGFSGHGSQQVPARGRGVAELITYGVFKTLDLSSLLYARIAKEMPLYERAVI